MRSASCQVAKPPQDEDLTKTGDDAASSAPAPKQPWEAMEHIQNARVRFTNAYQPAQTVAMWLVLAARSLLSFGASSRPLRKQRHQCPGVPRHRST